MTHTDAAKKDIVLVTGAFDVMHIGHIEILKYAASFGKVFVAIDYDDKIKLEKGPNRPFNTFRDRKKFLEAIVYVDSVLRIWLKRTIGKHLSSSNSCL